MSSLYEPFVPGYYGDYGERSRHSVKSMYYCHLTIMHSSDWQKALVLGRWDQLLYILVCYLLCSIFEINFELLDLPIRFAT